MYFEGNFEEIRREAPEIVRGMERAGRYGFTDGQVRRMVEGVGRWSRKIPVPEYVLY